MTEQQTHSVDILIVGAGPTGLTLANILGQAGIRTLIIDRKPSTVAEPRAVSIDDESLRTMQFIGLDQQVLKDVVLGYGVHYFTRPGGYCFGKVEPTRSEYGFPRRNAFRQPLFEATLRQGAQRFAALDMRFGHELESFSQADGQVQALIRDVAGQPLKVSARYLVACDGGRSPVRTLLDIPMSGATFKSRWIVLDTENDDDPFWQTRVYCDARRPIVEVPGPHRTRRFEVMIHPHEDAEAMLQDECISEFLRPFRGDKPTTIVRKVVYTFHARMAERWRIGNVFLAGDAAHLTPPYAGQGMNSGIRDAHNLGWKLAEVIAGRLPDAALDSYESERRPHAWALIKLALNLGEVMAPRSRWHAAAISGFFRLVAHLPPLRDYFLQMKFKPKPRYQHGLLVRQGRAAAQALVGSMSPQPRLQAADGSIVRLDDVVGTTYALLAFGTQAAQKLAGLQQPLWDALGARRIAIVPRDAAASAAVAGVVQCVDVEDQAQSFFKSLGPSIVLVRPDRYVAGSFSDAQEAVFAQACIDRFGLHATSAAAIGRTDGMTRASSLARPAA
ncbi:bifunctional 3-(3-hydroxy-phenyl)propionate/3-hydroxycinnamic acid hydroxylase [Herbaspirillum seropedicae]|uniref:bifunctional 3-(3-hydroxy-phenyl)propionate/3-hydroxycinnamic acid hydroxylase n=1 Tax=Herbaspirillum seropedicae TaxID=964 RepID=UPI000847F326|nr:bifunctional 3-(3-hydroxy-phenyl)propionate/3-hydroxycinnamic acid hydroxylase [Herbaspirillum seropedicae]AON53708.1 3-(3-hydroxyphenyl)propionate hydroxylase [Herbaspirillum seropedicae]